MAGLGNISKGLVDSVQHAVTATYSSTRMASTVSTAVHHTDHGCCSPNGCCSPLCRHPAAGFSSTASHAGCKKLQPHSLAMPTYVLQSSISTSSCSRWHSWRPLTLMHMLGHEAASLSDRSLPDHRLASNKPSWPHGSKHGCSAGNHQTTTSMLACAPGNSSDYAQAIVHRGAALGTSSKAGISRPNHDVETHPACCCSEHAALQPWPKAVLHLPASRPRQPLLAPAGSQLMM
jgi:hypothetical protein